jgi:antitoxin component YwqK of YwqJK toxin-antitoxin module
VEYDENGIALAEGEYVANERDGEWKYLHGQVVEKGRYYDGNREGVWKTWFADGTLASEMIFDMDTPSGKFTYYWENGKIRMTGRYDAGERTATWYRYDENGNLILSIVYREGKEVMWNSYIID